MNNDNFGIKTKERKRYLYIRVYTEEEESEAVKLLYEAWEKTGLLRGKTIDVIEVVNEALRLYIEKLKEELKELEQKK